MFVYAFTLCMESGYKTVFRKRGGVVKQFSEYDVEMLSKQKFKKDAIYYLSSNFPVYSKILGMLLDNEVAKIILELPEHAMLGSVIKKSNMAFLPAHGSTMMLEAALTSLGIGESKAPVEDEKIFWGTHPDMLRIKEILPKITYSDISIHISGEVGSGKNAIAAEIARRRGFEHAVYINCASLTSDLADDMLFGHTKGAYTSASDTRIGLCKEADGGILFLDELQDLPPEAQSRLLHLLETGRFRQHGTNKELYSKFKIITSSSLSHMELKKRLRNDFMSRIATIVLDVPPLRDRIDDIEDLIDVLMRNRKLKKRPNIMEIERMKAYRWPGNIRELSSVLEYYDNLDELPEHIR